MFTDCPISTVSVNGHETITVTLDLHGRNPVQVSMPLSALIEAIKSFASSLEQVRQLRGDIDALVTANSRGGKVQVVAKIIRDSLQDHGVRE